MIVMYDFNPAMLQTIVVELERVLLSPRVLRINVCI